MINESEQLKCRSLEDDIATFETSISTGRKITNSFYVKNLILQKNNN